MADFDYELPLERIAQQPIEPRDAARLLVDRGPRHAPDHRRVRDLPDLLRSDDVLVVNDTRVIPARLPLRRASGGAAEVLLLEPLDPPMHCWEALVKPGRKLRAGEDLLDAGGEPVVRIGERRSDGTRGVELLTNEPLALLGALGRVPLPPYITTDLEDPERYQTVFAREPGSVAAPTAGLHLTDALLDALAARGVERHQVELVVGLDTFKPVTVQDPAHHRMHTERYRVPPEVWQAVTDARAGGRRVVAVGTTTVRALESVAARGSLDGRTDLFIRRPYPWAVVDVLLTNFHLPRTTLLLMIDAFVGPRWRDLYDVALAAGYRFLSFGDAMLLTRSEAR